MKTRPNLLQANYTLRKEINSEVTCGDDADVLWLMSIHVSAALCQNIPMLLSVLHHKISWHFL